jgi:hypothetical protein
VSTWFPPGAVGNAHRLAVRRLLESCDGVVTIAVLTAARARQPLTGDHVDDAMKASTTLLLRRISLRSRADAAACLFCAAPLWRGSPPAAIGVLMPYGMADAAHDVIGMLICTNCVQDHSQAELVRAVLSRLPGSRALPAPVNAVGHA